MNLIDKFLYKLGLNQPSNAYRPNEVPTQNQLAIEPFSFMCMLKATYMHVQDLFYFQGRTTPTFISFMIELIWVPVSSKAMNQNKCRALITTALVPNWITPPFTVAYQPQQAYQQKDREIKSGKELIRFTRNGKLPRTNRWVMGDKFSGTTTISIIVIITLLMEGIWICDPTGSIVLLVSRGFQVEPSWEFVISCCW